MEQKNNNQKNGYGSEKSCDQKGGISPLMENFIKIAENAPEVLAISYGLFRGKHPTFTFNVNGDIQKLICFSPDESNIDDFMAALGFDEKENN